MRLIPILFIIIYSLSAGAQSTCSSPAGEIIQNINPLICYPVQDTSDTLDFCFTFSAPGSILLFTSVPPANCATYTVTAALYDSACNQVSSSAFGIVFVTPGASYIWCGHYICSGSIGYSPEFCPTYSDFSPLPVAWLYFFGRFNRIEGAIKLSWATATEINSDYFEIQQGYDGQNFKMIGREPAAGFSNTTKYYQVIDEHPGAVNYYRIRQVDRDGKSSYSNTIFLSAIKEDDPDEIKIYDLSGRMVSGNGEAGFLSPGFYLIRYPDSVKKLIIK